MTAVLPTLAWLRSPNVSGRRGATVHLIVVHRPVGGYEGSIRTLCDPKVEASAHVITKRGGREATQLVRWSEKAWACEAFNAFSDNLEINDEVWTGRWARPRPLARLVFVSDDPAGWAAAARIVAFRCHARGVPARWTQRPHDLPGICRHLDLGRAGGGHTDPTQDDRIWRQFITAAAAELKRGSFRPSWGRD